MISKITTINSNNSKNKRRKILETTAILAGTTAIFPAGFLVADNFSNSKRNYTKKVEEEINKYKKTVEKRTNAGLNLLNRLGSIILLASSCCFALALAVAVLFCFLV